MNAFNLAFHDFMLSLGAEHERIEEHWEDVGDAENGPELSGHPAFDVYRDADTVYVVDENGRADHEPRDLEMEQAAAEMAHYGRNE